MNILVLRRKIKSRMETTSEESNKRIPFLAMSLSLLVLVLLVFCILQLTIVSVLSPHGAVLVRLNTEKDALVEENRILEQKIAERVALSVISSRAESELKMNRADEVLYLTKPSVSAEAPVAK